MTAAWLASLASAFVVVAPAAAIRPATAASLQRRAGARRRICSQTSEDCLACHNGLRTPSGEDVSIGASWRASMMANSARDPYWQAAVRRETIDHPGRGGGDSGRMLRVPHADGAHRGAARAGARAGVRAPAGRGGRSRDDRLAHDGVSCTICHQITGEKLGTPASFTGGYVVDAAPPLGKSRGAADARPIFGPFEVESGLHRDHAFGDGVSRRPKSAHIRQSELCATCHTLFTKALGPSGEVIGELPEQMPYLEWRHSAFRIEARSCQSCHMRAVAEDMPDRRPCSASRGRGSRGTGSSAAMPSCCGC